MTDPPASVAEPANSREARFVFVACQPASQQICKQEIATTFPQWSPAYSRPGFLTYKTPQPLPERFDLPLTFARTFGWSESGFAAGTIDDAAGHLAAWLVREPEIRHIHIWQRAWTSDPRRLDTRAQQEVDELADRARETGDGNPGVNQIAEPDARVMDVIRIGPRAWWVGHHIAGTTAGRWPGGIPLLREPENMVSRAYLKTAEAILWSGISISKSDVCAEIGSAPGGSCQRLLELGAQRVIAIDPAEMDDGLLTDERLEHLKMRGRDVPHRQLADVTWLLVDSNVAPAHTLDTVQALTTGKQTRFRGLLLTLKFSDPKMLDEISGWIERVKSWGFKYVRTRQLAYGRQEICLVALKRKSVRRFRG